VTTERSLKEQITEYIGKSGLQLPMFNRVALELQDALGDENVSQTRIEEMIAKDPALTSQMLRMANSSAFAGLTQISTVKQALMRLGIKHVARLAIAASQMNLYRSKSTLVNAYMSELWHQAYACAVGASWVAERTGRPDAAEPAFLAGLLHDIGKLLILRALEDIGAKAAGGQELPKALVDEVLDSLHCGLGFELMKHWNLPDQYCTIGRDHHREAFDPSETLLVIVRLLDQVCAKMGIGRAADPDMVPAAGPEAQALGMSEVQLAELEIVLEDSMAPA
jgi:HD-like signal output (HDOD) protein